MAQVLLEYFSALKIKTTQVPVPLQVVIAVLKISFCIVIFPQAMSYLFLMKLSSTEAKNTIVWRNPLFYITAYVVITGLSIMFFTTLHAIAKELDDPYGDDISDLPLKQMRSSLVDDMLEVRRSAFPVHDLHTHRSGAPDDELACDPRVDEAFFDSMIEQHLNEAPSVEGDEPPP